MSKKKQNKRVTNAEIMAKLDVMAPQVEEIHDCVFSNPDPKKGLVHRMLMVEGFQAVLKKVIWAALLTVISGGIGYYLFTR